MKKTKNKIFKKNGYIVAYLMIATSVAITLLMGLVIFAAKNQKKSKNDVARNQALQLAEYGIYYYKWYLAHNLDGKTVQQIKQFWQGNPIGVDTPYEQEVQDFSGEATGKYRIEVEPPDPDSTIVIVTSTGWTYRHPEITKSVRVRFRRPSWSEYAVLGNDVMRFGSGTHIYGKVHSNNGIRFDGVAHNIVNSAVEEYLDPDTNKIKPGVWTTDEPNADEVFLAGRKYPVPAIDFNGVIADLGYIRDEAQAGGLYLGEATHEKEVCDWYWCGPPPPIFCQECHIEQVPIKGYHLILNTDDTVEVRAVFDYEGNHWWEDDKYNITSESSGEIYDLPSNGLIYSNNHVWISGQIDTARVTVVAANLETALDPDIFINNDIIYTNKDGRDVIGLIAENNISIGYYSEDELEVDAALLAQKGRVGRNYYPGGGGAWKNSITIFGSIATNQRYGFSWTDGTGYDTRNLYFDNNLIYYPPPYFPTGTVYELDLWEDL